MGVKHLLVEVDSASAVSMILNDSIVANCHMHLIASIRDLLHRQWVIKIYHVFREANMVADRLADFAKNLQPGCHRLHQVPPDILQWIYHDVIGVGYSRMIPI